jgi:hypothetical protein
MMDQTASYSGLSIEDDLCGTSQPGPGRADSRRRTHMHTVCGQRCGRVSDNRANGQRQARAPSAVRHSGPLASPDPEHVLCVAKGPAELGKHRFSAVSTAPMTTTVLD